MADATMPAMQRSVRSITDPQWAHFHGGSTGVAARTMRANGSLGASRCYGGRRP